MLFFMLAWLAKMDSCTLGHCYLVLDISWNLKRKLDHVATQYVWHIFCDSGSFLLFSLSLLFTSGTLSANANHCAYVQTPTEQKFSCW